VIALDQDAVIAAADLADRAGARSLTVGWDCPHAPDADDEHACEQVTWHATAQFKGTRVTVERHPGPVEAVEALARRLLTGARCRCGKLVALSDEGAWVDPGGTLLDGTRLTPKQAKRMGQCRWTRRGKRWEPGCNAPPIRRKERF
jgi:hypothetical protein